MIHNYILFHMILYYFIRFCFCLFDDIRKTNSISFLATLYISFEDLLNTELE